MQRLCPGLALLNVASTGLSVLRCLGGVSRSTLSTWSTLSKSFRIPIPGIPGIPGTMALFTTVHCRLLDAAMLIPVINDHKTCHKTCQNTSEVLPRSSK